MKKSALLLAIVAAAALPLGGCVSKIVTAPFRAAGTVVETAVDATTQTKSEKEEDRGRRSLKAEKRLDALFEERKQVARQCRSDPGSRACDRLDALDAEIEQVRRGL